MPSFTSSYDLFRREQVFGSVQVGLEQNTLLRDLPQFPHAVDLIAAAVSEDGLRPVHESV